jgi:16S rRNA G966 N2-methylase RsmD
MPVPSALITAAGAFASGLWCHWLDTSIPQDRLDIANRTRVSAFPWRGQFSPNLVSALLEHYGERGCQVLDPFVGSGTVLVESARYAMSAVGTEVNPAAFQFAKICEMTALDLESRNKLLAQCDLIVNSATESPNSQGYEDYEFSKAQLGMLMSEGTNPTEVVALLRVSIMLAMGQGSKVTNGKLIKGYARAKSTLLALPFGNSEMRAVLADARNLPVDDASVDLVITSPPYINVFNYHEQYRHAAEMFGFDVLARARSEIGSNRKHRGNRFLTVIQYCIDMGMVMTELARVLKPTGRVVIVLGRTSSVRGVTFRNGELVAAVSEAVAGLTVETRRERRFTNRYGVNIFEDVLSMAPTGEGTRDAVGFGRALGVWALQDASRRTEAVIQLAEIDRAVAAASQVEASTIMKEAVA